MAQLIKQININKHSHLVKCSTCMSPTAASWRHFCLCLDLNLLIECKFELEFRSGWKHLVWLWLRFLQSLPLLILWLQMLAADDASRMIDVWMTLAVATSLGKSGGYVNSWDRWRNLVTITYPFVINKTNCFLVVVVFY